LLTTTTSTATTDIFFLIRAHLLLEDEAQENKYLEINLPKGFTVVCRHSIAGFVVDSSNKLFW
jgi:hypothetical protein